MRLTLVHPCIGRRRGQPYIRTWQMESLPIAVLAAHTPTRRELPTVVRIATRLRRGEALYEDDEALSA